MRSANRFAELGQVLRGFKRRQDDSEETRTQQRAPSVYRDVRETTTCYDRVETSTQEPGLTWDSDRWDYDEWK